MSDYIDILEAKISLGGKDIFSLEGQVQNFLAEETHILITKLTGDIEFPYSKKRRFPLSEVMLGLYKAKLKLNELDTQNKHVFVPRYDLDINFKAHEVYKES